MGRSLVSKKKTKNQRKERKNGKESTDRGRRSRNTRGATTMTTGEGKNSASEIAPKTKKVTVVPADTKSSLFWRFQNKPCRLLNIAALGHIGVKKLLFVAENNRQACLARRYGDLQKKKKQNKNRIIKKNYLRFLIIILRRTNNPSNWVL